MPSFNTKHTPKRYTLPKNRLRKRLTTQPGSLTSQDSKKTGFFNITKNQNFLKTINSTLVGIIVLACVLFFVYAPFFGISKINYTNNSSHLYDDAITQVITENLSGYYWGLVPKNHIALFDPIESLTAFTNHPYITDLHIEKHFFNSVDVQYTLRQPAFIFETPRGLYTVDTEGYALALLENIETYKDLPLIHTKYQITLAQQIPNKKYLDTLTTLYNTMIKEFGIGIVSCTLIPESYELQVKTNEGWDLLLALDREIEPQLDTLMTVVTSELSDKTQRSELDYIDVRIEQWVYYK